MVAKPGTTTFIQNWNKTVSWAKQNNIPYAAYYPVYQMDAQRLLSGSPMSEAERIRAIQAASGLNYSTALPTDSPAPSDLLGNIRTNLANIFTGLEPQHLLSNIWDTVTNTVEHPSSLYGIAIGPTPKGTHGGALNFDLQSNFVNFRNHVLAPHSIWSWVPGMADLAELMGGHAGAKQLADNPITSLLDILPLGRAVPKAIARDTTVGEDGLSFGARTASRLGVSQEELSKMDSIQLSYRLLKTLPLPGEKHPAIQQDAAGNVIDIRPMNIGERINAFRNASNIGKEQADIYMGAIIKSQDGTKRVMELAGPAVEALGSLSKDEYMLAMKALATDHRPEQELLSDPQYAGKVADALAKVYEYGHMRLQTKMQSGEMAAIPVTHIDDQGVQHTVTEYYTTKPGSSGYEVVRDYNTADRAQQKLDKAAKPLDGLIYKTQLSDRKIMGAFTNLEQRTQAVYNAIKAAIPELTDDEQLARLRQTLPHGQKWDRPHPNEAILRNLFGLPPKVTDAARRRYPDLKSHDLTMHHVNVMRDLFQPGGLLDQMGKAYKDADWLALSKYSKVAVRKFDNKIFDDIPKDGNAVLWQTKNIVQNLHDYAVARERDVNTMNKLLNGTRHGQPMAGKWQANSIMSLSIAAAKAHQQFLKTAIEHPPDVWRDVYLTLYTDQIMRNEKSAALVDEGAKALVKRGVYTESEVDKLRQDPRTIIELMVHSARNSLENSMMPDIEIGLSKELSNNAYEELSRLRAQGHTPAYIPTLSPHDIKEGVTPSYDVYLGSLRPKTPRSTFSRTFDFTSSVYDVQLGILKDAKDQISNDVLQEFKDEYVSKYLMDTGEVNEMISKYMSAEISANAAHAVEQGFREEGVDSIILAQARRMGLTSYDPESIFGPISAAKLDKPYYINEHLASALKSTVDKFQFPAEGFWDRGTKVFRFSILGLSPRYTAHIVFGGTWLLAARGHPAMFKQLRAGYHVATTGKLPDDLVAEHPFFSESQTTSATQEGQADILFHKAAGYTAGNKVIQEFMANHGYTNTTWNWIKAAAQVNFKFTRAVVAMQRTVVYLDGAARASKEGSFSEPKLIPRIDDHGNPVTNPITGQQLYDEIHQRVEMTPERAHQEGMQAVAHVMGELRHMTPLERQVFVRAFPFYGWTKHVLTYVLTYPIDHPYRATFLSQLATQNSADVATGLPTRIQLLMFLGQPDQYGNVSAIDTRFMDPLRDTANYATLTGIFQSLNPILSAPLAQVDPQITFGSNELYPSVTFSQLYGIKEAGPQGTLYTAAEQFVPQLTALDAAFNLSGQYAYLKMQGGDAFYKKVFQSLNIPFFQMQHLNLRQIAAKQELDRYQIAQQDAYRAATTGDLSTIATYPSNALLPDPLNVDYNVTPEYIKAMTQQSEKQTGLPFYETATRPRNPPL